ncbi:nicotinamide-nucleotide amidohydrolase PncC [Acidiphilium sp. JA12-A1]|nr:nicotinamide-nucleotide amidohydrolase PncC [Acidiphilium sp. JA12-A1]
MIGRAREAGRTIATAESCTGGMIAAALTDIAGASAVFGHGFVSYANDAKVAMLGVEPGLIAREGAVSETVARAMAEGARARAGADLAVAVTGIAGPEGGSAEKPVGTVWFGVARKDGATLAERRVFPGGRDAVRRATVDHALDLLAAALG